MPQIVDLGAATPQRTAICFSKEPTMAVEKVLYTAKVHTTGGRDGASRSSDGRLDIKLSSLRKHALNRRKEYPCPL